MSLIRALNTFIDAVEDIDNGGGHMGSLLDIATQGLLGHAVSLRTLLRLAETVKGGQTSKTKDAASSGKTESPTSARAATPAPPNSRPTT